MPIGFEISFQGWGINFFLQLDSYTLLAILAVAGFIWTELRATGRLILVIDPSFF